MVLESVGKEKNASFAYFTLNASDLDILNPNFDN